MRCGRWPRDGWRVRAAVRRPDLAGHLQPMGAVGQIHAVQANLRYPDCVRRAVEGARRGGEPGRHPGQVRARRPSRPCTWPAPAPSPRRRARPAPGRWCTSRRSAPTSGRRPTMRAPRRPARRPCSRSFPGAVILRPSLVFGPEDQLFNRFAAMARFSPFLPLIGGGRTKLQPVYAGDVAAAIAAACAGKAKPGHDLRARRARGRHLPPAARQDAGVVGPQAPLSAHPLLGGQARRAAHRCRCRTACARSPSTRSACCSATTW